MTSLSVVFSLPHRVMALDDSRSVLNARRLGIAAQFHAVIEGVTPPLPPPR